MLAVWGLFFASCKPFLNQTSSLVLCLIFFKFFHLCILIDGRMNLLFLNMQIYLHCSFLLIPWLTDIDKTPLYTLSVCCLCICGKCVSWVLSAMWGFVTRQGYFCNCEYTLWLHFYCFYCLFFCVFRYKALNVHFKMNCAIHTVTLTLTCHIHIISSALILHSQFQERRQYKSIKESVISKLLLG